MLYGRIIGWGKAVPDQILTNADLEKMVETSDEWIVTRTGIRERRIAPARFVPEFERLLLAVTVGALALRERDARSAKSAPRRARAKRVQASSRTRRRSTPLR